jgi:hypothetical protein
VSSAPFVVRCSVRAATCVALALVAFGGLHGTLRAELSPSIVTWVKGRLLPPKSGPASTHRHDQVHGWIRTTDHEGRFEYHGLDWRLDDKGRFREQVQEYRACGEVDFWFEFQDERGGFETGFHVGLPGIDDLPEPNPEEIDLGDLEFPVARSIAKGRVVTVKREPVAGVHVSLEGSLVSGLRVPWAPEHLEEEKRLQTTTRADGSFDLLATFPVSDCGVRLSAPGFLDAGIEIPCADPLECVLIAEARIEGVVDLDSTTWREPEPYVGGLEIEVVAHLHDSLLAGWDCVNAPIDREGRYSLGGLEAGDVDVRVVDHSGDGFEVLRWIPHVTLRAGEAADDPRLRKLAFRRGSHARLRFVSDAPKAPRPATSSDDEPEAEPGPAGKLVAVDGRGDPTGWSQVFVDGDASIRPPTDVRRVEVRVDGFRTAWIEDVRRDATIHLRPGISVKIVVTPSDLSCVLQAALVASKERTRDVDRRVFEATDAPLSGRTCSIGGEDFPPGMGGDDDATGVVVDEPDPREDPPTDPPEDDAAAEETPIDPPNPDVHPGILCFTLNEPGAFDLVLWNGSEGGLIPIPRESAVLDVKESADLQVFEIHLDPDVVRSLRNE